MNTISTSRAKYLIRGGATAEELRKQHATFVGKTKARVTLDEWLVEQKKVYVALELFVKLKA